jgi:glutamate dehydrogenase
MTVDPKATESLGEAYLATYRGPHGGAPDVDATDTGPLVSAA